MPTSKRRRSRLACQHQVIAITGGPGTGKTTSIRAILALFDALKLDTQLAAPTGRAAKRMSELTGQSAQTIHRLLEAGMSDDHQDITFRRDEDDPLECDAVILDECSMVDISLMCALLRAMRPECRLILVGDADQLPSVGPGNVFSDIIRSGVVPTVRLTEIFRQAAGQQHRLLRARDQPRRAPAAFAKQRGLSSSSGARTRRRPPTRSSSCAGRGCRTI
ncbi:MAG: AAA family ATPase [Oscillospiraceae bacterium]